MNDDLQRDPEVPRDVPDEPDITVAKGRMIPVTEYRQGFNWSCSRCGWRGVDCFGERSALAEAKTHMNNVHPDIERPTLAPDGEMLFAIQRITAEDRAAHA